jgi:hypothetical protein
MTYKGRVCEQQRGRNMMYNEDEARNVKDFGDLCAVYRDIDVRTQPALHAQRRVAGGSGT